ncbi:MAG: rod shape-determining protein MreC [Actinomycetota bacterium]|nr:rod shape-determining protein MreC [Actinomycetota bacterium]
MPRPRTARLPVLSTHVPRSERSRTKGGPGATARAVALALALVSLALVTLYFRESSSGFLHGTQRIAASVLTPFEVAGERAVRPFRDAYGWTADLFGAKAENADLRREVEVLRRQVIENETAARENEELRKLLEYRAGPRFPADYEPVATRVLVQPQTIFRQEVVVAAGSSDGVRVDDPVVTDEGLVGTVTEATVNAAKVRLLTDQQSAASGLVLETQASGVVLRGASDRSLILDRVPKDDRVEKGNIVITAGTRIGKYQSLYPRGIPICLVTSVSQRDVDFYKHVQCSPFVDFDALHEVVVLRERGRR